VCPTVKFSNDLIEWQASSNHRTDYLIRGHAGYSEVSRAPLTMLAGVFAAHCVIDLLAPERRVNHYGLAANGFLDLFQQLRQSLQVTDFHLRRGIVKLTVVGDGQFVKGEVLA
jgi:hypothetical protein